MDRNQIYPEGDIPSRPSPIPISAKSLETSHFSKITRPFFYVITLLGFRVFAFPGECCCIGHCSVFGITFALPAFGIAGYYIYYMGNQVLQTQDIYGFFSGLVSVLFEMELCYLYLFAYLVHSLLKSRELRNFIYTMDSLSLSEKSLKHFSVFHSVTLIFAIALHLFVGYEMINAYHQMLKSTGVTALKYIDYLTFYSMVYVTAICIYPLSFLALFAFFLCKTFEEQLQAFRSIPKSQLEDRLPWFYVSYLKLTSVLEEADNFFGWVIFGMIGITLINLSTYILNISNVSGIPTAFLFVMTGLMVFNFLGFNFLCIWLNEKSRAVEVDLHEILPHNANIFRWVDTIHRKVIDASWGLTFGKFYLFERTAFIGLISAMVTFLALYGQFAQSNPAKTNSTSIDLQTVVQQVRSA